MRTCPRARKRVAAISRPLAECSNSLATDAERQRLLPFVTRLACADTRAVEVNRAAFIRSKSVADHSFDYGLKVLEEALAIGRQAEAIPAADVRSRMEEFQSRASRSTSLADSPLLAKVKSWFEPKKQTEAAV